MLVEDEEESEAELLTAGRKLAAAGAKARTARRS
jgi:hypothetical protein